MDKRIRQIEERFMLPEKSLDGIQFITGVGSDLANNLNRPDLLDTLVNPNNAFVIRIKQGDPIIRTTIHTNTEAEEWELVTSGLSPVRWRNVEIPNLGASRQS